MDSTELERLRAKYKLKPNKVEAPVQPSRAEWERKPVSAPKSKPAPKKDYYKISYEDLVFWVANANRTIFIDALARYNKMKKRGVSLEIRWYTDRIDIHES